MTASTHFPVSITLAAALARISQLEHALGQAPGPRVPSFFPDGLTAVPHAAAVLTAAGAFQAVNEEFCRLWGLAGGPAAWLGRTVAALEGRAPAGPAEGEPSFAGWLQQARTAEPLGPPRLVHLAAGSTFRAHLTPCSEQRAAFLLELHDVSAAEAAAARRQDLARLAEQSPVLLLRLAPRERLEFVNAAARAWADTLRPAEREAVRTRLRGLAGAPAEPAELACGGRHFQVEGRPGDRGEETAFYLTEVTHRHRAGQILGEERDFFEKVLIKLPGDVAVFDAAHRYRFLNPQAIRSPEIRAWIIGKDDFEYCAYRGFPQDRATQRRAYFTKALTERCEVQWEEELPVLEGTHYFLRRFLPIFKADGTLDFMLGYGLNITDRHGAEERLRRSDELLREQQAFQQLVLDVIPAAVYVRDQGQITFSNRAMQDLTDLMGGQDPCDQLNLLGPAAREAQHGAQVDAQVLATGQEVRSEDSLTLSSGEVRWFQTVKCPFPRPDGSVLVLGASTDVTASKEAQLRLERSEKRYRDLQHYALALVYTHTPEGQVLTVNPTCAALLGTPIATLEGGYLAEVLPLRLRPMVARYLARLSAHGEFRGVVRIGTTTHQSRFVLYHSHVVHEQGQAPYIIGYGQDITDWVVAERELKRSKKVAETAAQARTAFLANMSHEIRTPLNGVLGMAALLAKTPLEPAQREQVAIIHSSGQHLLTVINDVLDVAKITSGKLELELTPFNLCESIRQAVVPLAQQAQARGLEFRTEPLLLDCPWVLGDPFRLNQIILNLLSNAIKFTPHGFIELSGRLLAQSPEAITVEFRVSDTGIGIASDKLQHIFESFTQANAGTTRQFGGTGLGLSISRALVEQLGGCLTVESALGKGSSFAFSLTLPVAEAPAAVEAPEAETDSLAGLRVLLVEDNTINRLVARQMVQSWGGHVAEAVDGPAALALFEQNRYDVILMDIQLPGMSGLEVTQHVRRHPDAQRAAIPILALTANAYYSDMQQYLAAGMNDCLAKPYEELELCHKLQALRPKRGLPYDLSKFRVLANGNTAFVPNIIRSFLTDIPPRLQQLQAAVRAGEWQEAGRQVHFIKPNLEALAVAGTAEPIALLEQLHREALATPAARQAADAAATQLSGAVAAAMAGLRQEPECL